MEALLSAAFKIIVIVALILLRTGLPPFIPSLMLVMGTAATLCIIAEIISGGGIYGPIAALRAPIDCNILALFAAVVIYFSLLSMGLMFLAITAIELGWWQ